MRPRLNFLDPGLLQNIIAEAKALLADPGIEAQNQDVKEMLLQHGAQPSSVQDRIAIPEKLVARAMETVPSSFSLFDASGSKATHFKDYDIHFTPGSSALHILDAGSGKIRKPFTADYVRYARIADQLPNIASQSTAMVCADVPEAISDSYRLFLSLLYGRKPVVTGTFSISSFELMKNMLVAMRGSAQSLREQPLAMFTCCPTSPLKWSDDALQNLLACGEAGIPVEIVAMPMAGFTSPVTLTGTLIQHTAEVLSGIVISQLEHPGTPLMFGSSAAIFDMRYQTPPMGAGETLMIDAALNEIGKALGLPTQAYITLSDAKAVDMQAGLETGMGAAIGALSGINNMSGPGMIDFENCHSTEKLIVDNEICGTALRTTQGIDPKDDFPSAPRIRELLQEGHLLTSAHTLEFMGEEHFVPGVAINRMGQELWQSAGAANLSRRIADQMQNLLASDQPVKPEENIRKELESLMAREASLHGLDHLPDRE